MPVSGAWIVDILIAVFLALIAIECFNKIRRQKRGYGRGQVERRRLSLIQQNLDKVSAGHIGPISQADAKKIWKRYCDRRNDLQKSVYAKKRGKKNILEEQPFSAYFSEIFPEEICRRISENDIERDLVIMAIGNADYEAVGADARLYMDGDERLCLGGVPKT